MMDISYSIPSVPGVKEVVVDEDSVIMGTKPKVLGSNNMLLEVK